MRLPIRTFSSGPAPISQSWHEKEYEDPDRVFLAVEATHISIIYLRPTLELLGKAHPRLPATFYRMLLEGVSSWIWCYDESACEAFSEWSMESYLEAKESGEEGLEKPQSIANAKGAMAGETVQAAPARKIDAAIESLKMGRGRAEFWRPLAGSKLPRQLVSASALTAMCGTNTIPTAVSRFHSRSWPFTSRTWSARPFRVMKKIG
jgi:hypothetical protein